MSAEFTRGMFKGENFNGLYGAELQGNHEREMGVIDRADRAAVCTNLVLAAFVILALGGSVGLSILSRSHLTHQWYYLGPGIGLGATTLGLIAWMAIQSYLHMSEKQQANERYAQASGERVALHQILEDTLKAAEDEQALADKIVVITATEHKKALVEAATAEFMDKAASEPTEGKRQILEVLGREAYQQQKRSVIRVLASEFPEQMIAQVNAKQRDLAIYLTQNLDLGDEEPDLQEAIYAKINAIHDKVAIDILVSEFSGKMIEQVNATNSRAFAIILLQTADRAKIDEELRDVIYAKIGAPQNSAEANLLAADADAVRAHVATLDEAAAEAHRVLGTQDPLLANAEANVTHVETIKAAKAYRLAMLEHTDPNKDIVLMKDLIVLPETQAEGKSILRHMAAIDSYVTTHGNDKDLVIRLLRLGNPLELDGSEALTTLLNIIGTPTAETTSHIAKYLASVLAKIAKDGNEYGLALMDFTDVDERIILAVKAPASTHGNIFAKHPIAMAKIANAEKEYLKIEELGEIFGQMSDENRAVLFKALTNKGHARMQNFVSRALGADLHSLLSPGTLPSQLICAFYSTYAQYFKAHVLENTNLSKEEQQRASIALNVLEHLDDQAAKAIIGQMDEKHFIRQVKILVEESNAVKATQISLTRQKLMQRFFTAENAKGENIFRLLFDKLHPLDLKNFLSVANPIPTATQ